MIALGTLIVDLPAFGWSLKIMISRAGDRMWIWITVGLALAIVMAPAAVFLNWYHRRWWLRRVGEELIEEAGRAEVVLLQHKTPRGFGQRVRHWWVNHMPFLRPWSFIMSLLRERAHRRG
ncbi:hypothetical protein ABZ470_10320 [Streptosporangium sp. NPDC020072]|uniref:hypothetical protein n=1 Tax=Streptosporangium sp. NPDC020072 TaxID=3154788 RepID=UPI00341F2C7B